MVHQEKHVKSRKFFQTFFVKIVIKVHVSNLMNFQNKIFNLFFLKNKALRSKSVKKIIRYLFAVYKLLNYLYKLICLLNNRPKHSKKKWSIIKQYFENQFKINTLLIKIKLSQQSSNKHTRLSNKKSQKNYYEIDYFFQCSILLKVNYFIIG